MENLFVLLFLISVGSVGYGSFRIVSNRFGKKNFNKSDNKRIILSSVAALVISFVGVGLTASPPSQDVQTNSIELSVESTTDTSEEAEAARRRADEARQKADEEKKKQEEAKQLALEEQEKNSKKLEEVRSTLADLEYEGTQTIELNENIPFFSTLDLSLDDGSWEAYGDLDNLNRATSAEGLLNQDLMPTEERGDISKVEPTGWKNKKLGNGYLYNRSHLIGFSLSGENDNWKNLITGTTQLNNPEMLRHEMDVKTYLEQSEDNYVRYSVTPIFKEDDLLARGVHLMAQSINDDAISFNVYIFNVQDGVKINYADGSSETDEEIAAAKKAEEDRIAAEKAEQERIEAEKAEQERVAAEQSEQQRIAEEQAAQEQAAQEAAAQEQATSIEQTVYVAPQSGTKYHYSQSCRGLNNANSTVSMSLSEAQAQGYSLCGWED